MSLPVSKSNTSVGSHSLLLFRNLLYLSPLFPILFNHSFTSSFPIVLKLVQGSPILKKIFKNLFFSLFLTTRFLFFLLIKTIWKYRQHWLCLQFLLFSLFTKSWTSCFHHEPAVTIFPTPASIWNPNGHLRITMFLGVSAALMLFTTSPVRNSLPPWSLWNTLSWFSCDLVGYC